MRDSVSEKSLGRLRVRAVLFIATLVCLGGCTPEKARQIQTAASQFQTDARAGITAIQGLMDAEIAPPSRTDAQKADQFAANILSLSTTTRLSSDLIDMAIDPYTVKLSSSASAARNELFDSLTQQYSAFSSMFDDLQRGSFLARGRVEQTKQYAVMLTAQLAGFAKVISDNPPRFVQQRTALLVQVDKARKDSELSADQKRQALADLMSRWQALQVQEAALQQDVVQKCLNGAASGQSVLTMIDSYDKLSVDDLNQTIQGMMSFGEQISGKSLADLRARNDKVMAFLSANPEYKAVADAALAHVQQQYSGAPSK